MRKNLYALIFVTLTALSVFAQQQSSSDLPLLEQGKFTLHKFEQPIGEETYEIHRDGDSITAKIDFKFTDRGSPVPLTTTFRGASDLTPQAFEIKGRTARPVSIDEALTIDNGKVHLRSRDTQTDSDAPSRAFFTIEIGRAHV